MKENKITAVRFFEQDYINQASYDNLRKIASAIDGLKNSSRKVIYTVLDKNLYELTKVSQLSAKAAEHADYLHGSLDGVVVTLAQDYLGSNQIPLLQRKGNFGTRAIPEASASRYIFASGSSNLKSLFNKEDNTLLIQQTFEGTKIEPMFYVPELPILLLNGSKGISSGFAQNILPRDQKEIIKILKRYAKSQKLEILQEIDHAKPFIGAFNGTVERDSAVSGFRWIFTVDYKIDKNTVTVNDIPYGSDLLSYLKTLDSLEDQKKIKGFEDYSEGDTFKFIVKFDRKTDLSKLDIIKLLKLQTSVTENFTCLDQHNKIFEAGNVSDILKLYVDVKEHYLNLRKQNNLTLLKDKLAKTESILKFILMIINNKIDFKNIKTEELDEIFSKEKFFNGGGFGYLHRIPVGKMTKDQVTKLEQEITEIKQEIQTLEGSSIYDIWLG